jgi:hypothetical protein
MNHDVENGTPPSSPLNYLTQAFITYGIAVRELFTNHAHYDLMFVHITTALEKQAISCNQIAFLTYDWILSMKV